MLYIRNHPTATRKLIGKTQVTLSAATATHNLATRSKARGRQCMQRPQTQRTIVQINETYSSLYYLTLFTTFLCRTLPSHPPVLYRAPLQAEQPAEWHASGRTNDNGKLQRSIRRRERKALPGPACRLTTTSPH